MVNGHSCGIHLIISEASFPQSLHAGDCQRRRLQILMISDDVKMCGYVVCLRLKIVAPGSLFAPLANVLTWSILAQNQIKF